MGLAGRSVVNHGMQTRGIHHHVVAVRGQRVVFPVQGIAPGDSIAAAIPHHRTIRRYRNIVEAFKTVVKNQVIWRCRVDGAGIWRAHKNTQQAETHCDSLECLHDHHGEAR